MPRADGRVPDSRAAKPARYLRRRPHASRVRPGNSRAILYQPASDFQSAAGRRCSRRVGLAQRWQPSAPPLATWPFLQHLPDPLR